MRTTRAQVLITATAVPLNGIGAGRTYSGMYDHDLSCGEVSRNICVNLSIDPDQTNGVITNVQFYRILSPALHASASASAATSITTSPCASPASDVRAESSVSSSSNSSSSNSGSAMHMQHWDPAPEVQLSAAAPGGHLQLLVKQLVRVRV